MESESLAGQDRLQKMHQTIADAPSDIEHEFATSPNSWLACFGSCLWRLEAELSMAQKSGVLSEEQYLGYHNAIEALKKRLDELHHQYPTRDTVPPYMLQKELLGDLNIFEER